MVGKKEAPGRPILYGTTREFLQYFGLGDLTELPTLKDLEREEAA
jgi:segregation and condensation protein B